MKIVHASIDENKKISGGKAGDQNGKEVFIRSWYNKPWDMVLRYKDETVAQKATNIAMQIASAAPVAIDESGVAQSVKDNEVAVAIEKTKAELGKKARSDEDVLSYIAFPQVAEKFFEAREEKESNTVNYTIEKKED